MKRSPSRNVIPPTMTASARPYQSSAFRRCKLAPALIRIQEKPSANWVTPAKVNAIRGEFMRQCDKLDGLADGIINNYMACRAIFDVTQGAPNRQPWAAKRCPGQCGPESGRHERERMSDGRTDFDAAVHLQPLSVRSPLANGAQSFGMWVPNTDPSGSGLISECASSRTGRSRGRRTAVLASQRSRHNRKPDA